MTIDGINPLTAYKLKLMRESGINDLPARKQGIQFPSHSPEEIKHTPRTVTLYFFGKYATGTLLRTAMNGFSALILGDNLHTFVCPTGTFTGACTEGAQVTIKRLTVQLELKITVNYALGD